MCSEFQVLPEASYKKHNKLKLTKIGRLEIMGVVYLLLKIMRVVYLLPDYEWR